MIINNNGIALTELVVRSLLTHIPLDKMVPISQMTFMNAFLWIKSFMFYSNFTEVCSYGYGWQWVNIGSSNGLAPNWWQAITCSNVDSFQWLIYAAQVGDDLNGSVAVHYINWCVIANDFLTETPVYRRLRAYFSDKSYLRLARVNNFIEWYLWDAPTVTTV